MRGLTWPKPTPHAWHPHIGLQPLLPLPLPLPPFLFLQEKWQEAVATIRSHFPGFVAMEQKHNMHRAYAEIIVIHLAAGVLPPALGGGGIKCMLDCTPKTTEIPVQIVVLDLGGLRLSELPAGRKTFCPMD